MNASTLQTLIELATEHRDTAARDLGKVQNEHTKSQAQLDALIEYRNEYGARLSAAMAEGVSMHRLANDQRFMAALDSAIAQQERVVAQNEHRVAHSRSHWQGQQRRLKSFDALENRRQAEQTRRDNRREQQINDEAAERAARRADRQFA